MMWITVNILQTLSTGYSQLKAFKFNLFYIFPQE